jgi:hypothetical protein
MILLLTTSDFTPIVFIARAMSTDRDEQIVAALSRVSEAVSELVDLTWPMGTQEMNWDVSAYMLAHTNGDVIVNTKISNNGGKEVIKKWQHRVREAIHSTQKEAQIDDAGGR